MKKILILLLVNILLFLMLPFILSKGWTAPLAQYLPSHADEITDPARDVYVPVLIDETVEELPLTQYLCGVVAAEMPASYESEALKAQTVAACSYMVYRSLNEPNAPEHKGAWVCNDPSHCKGYLSPIQMKQTWGEDNYPQYYAKIAAAVGAVAGQVMTYEGEPINAVFHAISAGKTETAADVWGQDVPYLQAVESFVDVNAAQYLSGVEYSGSELYRLLSILDPQIDNDLTVGTITRTDSGGVRCAEIGGVTLTGAQLRSALSLRSTNFEITQKDDLFTFTVKGYGHCVGMSQHGAGQLAAAGMSYTDILKTYYTGISIEPYSFS
jgi:stage II sporulation protein D